VICRRNPATNSRPWSVNKSTTDFESTAEMESADRALPHITMTFGPLTLGDQEFMVQAALDGVGLHSHSSPKSRA